MSEEKLAIVGLLSKITIAEDQPKTTTTTKLKETSTSKSTPPRKRVAKRNQK